MKIERREVHLKSRNGAKLVCCWYTEQDADAEKKRPCVIYMHGNAGNKEEGAGYAPNLIKLGIDMFCFDFSGCGNSSGDWVTLGWKETEDLLGVLDFLNSGGKTSSVALWGRSMGAATSLMVDASKSPLPIGGLVLDSCFSDLSVLAKELAT